MSGEASTVDYRALLDEERKDLESKLEELGVGSGRLNYDSNFADSSQVTAERGEVDALAGKLQEALEEVLHALAKVADGTYGDCEDCGEPIAAVRLEAKPAAPYCINCASKH